MAGGAEPDDEECHDDDDSKNAKIDNDRCKCYKLGIRTIERYFLSSRWIILKKVKKKRGK